MIQTFSYLFYLKKPKKYSTGPIPVYLRITIVGKRTELFTGREVEPAFWNKAASRMMFKEGTTKEQVKKFNAYLDELQSKLYDAHHILIRDNKPITAESLRNKFTGAADADQRLLLPIFRKHNDEMEALIPAEYSPGTLERYRITINHMIDFLKSRYRVADIDIKSINHEFVTDFDFYLRSVRKCANNTTLKYVSYFKKIIRICIANGWLDKDPFVNFKPKLRTVDRPFLSEEELQLVINKEYTTTRMQQIKDIFLFSCFTGLAYSDVYKLAPGNVTIGIDGEKWLFINRTKTDTASPVPLLPVALAILDKYKDHPQCINQKKLLPVPSNQKMNTYLKEIAGTCGIPKDLTFHIARHTFATTVTLNNDVPIESVSKMLGHTSLKTTQHYAKLLNKKIGRDMLQLRSKFTGKLEVVKKDTGS